MKPSGELDQRLTRLQKWSERYDRLLEREARAVEALFLHAVADWDTEKKQKLDEFNNLDTQTKSQLDQAGKEYSQAKYRLERDVNGNREQLKRLEEEYRDLEKKYETELARINEEKTNLKISLERQKSALTDMYQEKMRHLTVTRAGLLREWQNMEVKVKESRDKAQDELTKINSMTSEKLEKLKESSDAKREGWAMALEAIKKELTAITTEKDHIEKRLTEIKSEKEKELDQARLAMKISREQLDVDKATLVEKAEEDQRKCEAEVADLRAKVTASERELQEFSTNHEKVKKETEEAFLKEELMLKDAVKAESERRDYEQKLYEQEKASKEKELTRLKEEYEKRKWHWDNQIRSLMMQKAVHDSEYDAERLRVDREARTALRSLEAKRDELKQRLSDIKSRHTGISANAEKEKQLINQRWHWRRDRLWALWQARLDVLKKERVALHEQIELLQQKFLKEKNTMGESESRDNQRTDDVQSYLLQMQEKSGGQRKQREIQFELEKTRLFAQIKELETLISDWTDRMKQTQADVLKEASGIAAQVGFLDRWYRDEEQETQVFLREVQDAMSVVQSVLDQIGIKKAA